MNHLLPFLISFFLPGLGHFIIKDYKKGILIVVSYLVLTFLFRNFSFLHFIPFWGPHVLIMIWALFDMYDQIEEQDGKKSATRGLAFSLLIVTILLPLTITLFATGLFKGAKFFAETYFNEDSTKKEMNKITIELGRYKKHSGVYPENYDEFISRKPIWGGFKADSWNNPYKYELLDS